jgi:hypothetical protein
MAFRSSIVVTSWWSNCLALASLHRLVDLGCERELYVVHAGKSAEQMARFRALMPRGVVELMYPEDLPADDSPMREYIALTLMRQAGGVWFVDHDTFFEAPHEPWFAEADRWFNESDNCLCIGEPRGGPGVTQPAYWLSPVRWPSGLSSFDPIPFKEKAYVRRPDLHRHDGGLIMPIKDTLGQVRDELLARGLAATYPLTGDAAMTHALSPFPEHAHLGGIHLYTGPANLPGLDAWTRSTVSRFEQFFASCPADWLEVEDPELLRRHREFSERLRTE